MKTYLSLIILCLLTGCGQTVVTYGNHILETNLSPQFVENTAADVFHEQHGEGPSFQPAGYSRDNGKRVVEQYWFRGANDKFGRQYCISVVTLPGRPTRVMVVGNADATANAVFAAIRNRLEETAKR